MNSTNDNANLRGRASGESYQSDQPMRLADRVLGARRHICAFFHNLDEEYRVLLPFIKEGLDRGEKAFHIINPKLRPEHLKRLRSAGIDVAAAEQTGQLEARNWEEVFLREGGHCGTDRMIAMVQELVERGRQQGFPLTRLIGHAEWVAGNWPGDFVEYEARLNYVLPQYKDTVICTYDLANFGGNILIDVIRTHPMIIMGGVVQENPFFVPPDEFLQERTQSSATEDA
jgi:MEDS: MEthanogen/methylotroph, DcmR Sensory domain